MAVNYAVIHLSEERPGENTLRRIRLDETNDSCLIGRASSKGFDIVAKPDNGYFENPVVSRNHAELRADFVYQRVYIKDIGSTHGTWVNKVRLPATVRHPLRTGDNLTLGVGIKALGGEVAQPTMTKVGVHFGTTSPFAEKGTCVFEVPDGSSVECSEPEDTLERARRFLHALDDKQDVHQPVDLTQDGDLHLDARVSTEAAYEDKVEDKFGSEDGVEDEIESEDEVGSELAIESGDEIDYEDGEMPSDSLFSQSEVEDNMSQEITLQAGELDDSPPKAPSIHEVRDLDYSVPPDLTTSTVAEVSPIQESPTQASPTYVTLEAKSESVSPGGEGLEAPYTPSVPGGSEASTATNPSVPNPEREPEGGASSSDSDTPQLSGVTSTMSKGIEAGGASEGHSSISRKRGSSEISSSIPKSISKKRKSPEISRSISKSLYKKRKASETSEEDEPQLSVAKESAVQTGPLDTREPKRLRRAADIVGYAALGGLAGGLALFTTLVVSAPTFS